MEKLRETGILTVAELAATAPEIKIPDLSRDVFLRLQLTSGSATSQSYDWQE
jgi:hypothetical protein